MDDFGSVTLKSFPKRHRITNIQEFAEGTSIADATEWFEAGADEFLTYADVKNTRLMRKMELCSKPLSDFSDVQRGVTPFDLTDEPVHQNSRLAFAGTVRRYTLLSGPKRFIRFDDSLAEPKPERYFSGPRLLLRELISRQFRLQAVRVTDSFVTNKSMQSILQLPSGPHLNFILGILNSKLLSWFFLHKSNVGQRDDFPKIVLRETRALPIFRLDATRSADQAMHDRIVMLVEQILSASSKQSLATTEAERNRLAIQIDSMDRQIDIAIFQLYGLTQTEIQIVENEGEGTP